MEPAKNSSDDYLGLGRLYLMQGKAGQSYPGFCKALEKSGNKTRTLKRIYSLFKKANYFKSFLQFLTKVKYQVVSQYDLDMAAAICHMDMKELDQAKSILIRLGQTWKKDQVFYFLAVIAQKQQDWDQMELAAHKAVSLKPAEEKYHYLFAKSLARQKKYSQAESAVSKAIQNAKKDNPWYHNFRASMHWAQENYTLAVSDWEKAFALKPYKSDFSYRLAQGYQAMGQFDKATKSIERALLIAPNNLKYKAFLKKLESI